MSREEILAARPGTWDDYKLLDVIDYFYEEGDRDRRMAVVELILRSPEHSEMVAYDQLYFDLIDYYRARDREAALRWAHAMIAYDERHRMDTESLSRMNDWRDLARIYLETGDADTGLAMYTRILRADPGDVFTYNVLGLTLSRIDLYGLAVEVLEKGVQLAEQDNSYNLQDQLTELREEAEAAQAQGHDRIKEIDVDVVAAFREALALETSPAGAPDRRPREGEDAASSPYRPPVAGLLSLGPASDGVAYAEVLSLGPVAVPELIWMAFDPALHAAPADDLAHHAPSHAVELLRRLRDETALDQLDHWLENAESDWYDELLSEHFGKVGGYTTDELKAVAADTTYHLYVRSSAIDTLAERATCGPDEQRERIVEFMRHLLNRPEAHEDPDEETFVGFLISAILDADARELYPDIKRAYEEDRVDPSIVRLGDVHHEWHKAPIALPERRDDGLYLRLKCTACGRAREHFVQHVLVDIPTLNRQQEGEEVPYSPYVMDREIVCPKCGAVDQYEMTPEGNLRLLGPLGPSAVAELLTGAEPSSPPPRNPRVHYLKMIAFGRLMHPLVALDEYRRRIAEAPEAATLHNKLGNVLRTLGRPEAALESYRRAHELAPDDADIALGLAMCAHDLGDRETARALYQRVLDLSGKGGSPLRRLLRRASMNEGAVTALDGMQRLKRDQESPWAPPWDLREEEEPKDDSSAFPGEPEPPRETKPSRKKKVARKKRVKKKKKGRRKRKKK